MVSISKIYSNNLAARIAVEVGHTAGPMFFVAGLLMALAAVSFANMHHLHTTLGNSQALAAFFCKTGLSLMGAGIILRLATSYIRTSSPNLKEDITQQTFEADKYYHLNFGDQEIRSRWTKDS